MVLQVLHLQPGQFPGRLSEACSILSLKPKQNYLFNFPNTISSSVVPFSSCPLSFPASGSFQMCWLLAADALSIGASPSTEVFAIYFIANRWDVCVCVCVCVYMHIHPHTCINVYIYTHICICIYMHIVVVVELSSHFQLFVTPWTAAHQSSMYLTISQGSPKFSQVHW